MLLYLGNRYKCLRAIDDKYACCIVIAEYNAGYEITTTQK